MKSILVLLALIATLAAEPHSFGWKSNPTHAKGLTQFVHHPAYDTSALPPVVDLSGVMPSVSAPLAANMPAVYDQGQEGSCTANAGTAAIEFRWHTMHGVFIQASRQGLYLSELLHDGNWPQDAGSMTTTVLWVLANQGIGRETLCPYSWPLQKKPTPAYYKDAKTHLAIHAYDVDNSDHVSIRVAISKGLPVMFGGYVYQSIETLNSSNYVNSLASGKPLGGHERLICGYDNTKKVTYSNGKVVIGFYWVRNSWGDSWGYEGYSWEPMRDIENPRINEDFAVLDLVN